MTQRLGSGGAFGRRDGGRGQPLTEKLEFGLISRRRE